MFMIIHKLYIILPLQVYIVLVTFSSDYAPLDYITEEQNVLQYKIKSLGE